MLIKIHPNSLARYTYKILHKIFMLSFNKLYLGFLTSCNNIENIFILFTSIFLITQTNQQEIISMHNTEKKS